MTEPPLTADEIQRRMAELRRSMSDDVERVRESSGTLFDWRYYVKRYPWPMMAAATAIGFLVVPRRVEAVQPDPEELAKLARENRIVIKENAEAKPQKGLGTVALGLLANALVRAGTAYVGQKAGKFFGGETTDANGRPHVPTQ